MKKLIFILFVLVCGNSVGQSITFYKTFNGILWGALALDIDQAKDSSYIVVGRKSYYLGSRAYNNAYLIRANKYGDTLWTRIFTDTIFSSGSSVIHAHDGGFIATGTRQITPCIYLMKTDSNGAVLWTKNFGNTHGNTSGGNCIRETYDNGMIITGADQDPAQNTHFLYLLKTDSIGDSIWTKRFSSGLQENIGSFLQITPDSGFIITGWTRNFIGYYYGDLFIVRTNSSGDLIWTKTYPDFKGYSSASASNNGYMILGRRKNGITAIYRINNLGDTLWTKNYPDFKGNSIINTNDGGYAITGGRSSLISPYLFDICLVKTDSLGGIQYISTFGGHAEDVGFSVKQTYDGGFVIAGYSVPDGVYMKTDENGNCPASVNNYENIEQNYTILFPNPTTSSTNIEYNLGQHSKVNLTVYNFMGSLVTIICNEQQPTGNYKKVFNAKEFGLSAGIYFVRLSVNGKSEVKKLVVVE
jgi:hypothetical protein